MPSALPLSRRPALLAGLLFVLTLALYARSWSFEFLNYDDDTYVTANEGVRGGLSWDGARWAFTTGHAANWHPLTWISHQLDVELFGLDAGAHHRTNALLHALNAALAFLALRALTRADGKSALAAAFFALHPLRVEAVAWVAERKELLAAGFGLASLWAYACYARRGGAGRYALSLACFALGLLAKPMLVTLPFVFLLLDAWPLGRIAWGRGGFGKPARVPPVPQPSLAPTHPLGEVLGAPRMHGVLREKLPFFVLAALSCLVTWRVQSAGGALGSLEHVGVSARCANAVTATGHYLQKSLWPTGLAVFHPHPALVEPARPAWTPDRRLNPHRPLFEPGPPAWTPAVLLTFAVLLALTLLVVRTARRAPFALVGWLWFLGMLVPVLGLVQVGLQGWAERYTYLPGLGLAVAVVWSAAELARTAVVRTVGLGLALVLLLVLSALSWRQLGFWRDSRTLFEHAVAVDESAVAHVNLALAAEAQGDLEQAERHDARALELQPGLSGVRVNLARVLRARGRPAQALEELEHALRDEPGLAPAEHSLGWLLAELGRDAEGLVHLRRALTLAPEDPALRNDLAWVLATSRDAADAEEARALAQGLVDASRGAQAAYLETLAAALARLGRFPEAIRAQELAIERVPASARARLAERLELYAAGRPFLKTP